MPEWIEFRKFDGTPHYRFAVDVLRYTGTELWAFSPAGVPLYKGETRIGELPKLALHHIACGRPYQSTWVFHPSAAKRLRLSELYVNLTAPLDRLDDPIVDMDLDVIGRPGRRPEQVDGDEFARNRVLMGYPADLAHLVASTADQLVRTLSDHPDMLAAIPPEILGEFERRRRT